MSNKDRVILLITVCVVLLCGCVGCNYHPVVERQTEYHDSIIELERCVLSEMGYCLCFDQPDIDSDNKIARIDIWFLTAYIENADGNQEFLETMEATRLLINSYLNENPDYYLNDGYIVQVRFLDITGLSNDSMPSYEWGLISNEMIDSYYPEDSLCFVCYSEILSSYIDADIGFEGIREIDLRNNTDVENIEDLLDLMPDVEIALVWPEDVRTELEARRPDIQFE